jgi:hypothetical protein
MTIEELTAQVELLTAALQAQGQATGLGQRSPILGPHKNLLDPKPSAKVAKQNFFYDGMELPSTRTEFPMLRFRLTETGVEEKCIRSKKELDALSDEWMEASPTMELPSPMESLGEAMASLSEDERRLVMEEQKKVRLSAIQAQLAALSPEDLASLTSGAVAPRKRGRPRKTE